MFLVDWQLLCTSWLYCFVTCLLCLYLMRCLMRYLLRYHLRYHDYIVSQDICVSIGMYYVTLSWYLMRYLTRQYYICISWDILWDTSRRLCVYCPAFFPSCWLIVGYQFITWTCVWLVCILWEISWVISWYLLYRKVHFSDANDVVVFLP